MQYLFWERKATIIDMGALIMIYLSKCGLDDNCQALPQTKSPIESINASTKNLYSCPNTQCLFDSDCHEDSIIGLQIKSATGTNP